MENLWVLLMGPPVWAKRDRVPTLWKLQATAIGYIWDKLSKDIQDKIPLDIPRGSTQSNMQGKYPEAAPRATCRVNTQRQHPEQYTG